MKRLIKAFTLSEVLLTLVIIGVVAALTIPFCVAEYQEHVKKVKIKKIYKDMNDVLEEAVSDGDKLYTGITYEYIYKIKPYLNIKEDCGTNEGCAAKGVYKKYDGEHWQDFYQNDDSYGSFYKMILADGSFVFFDNGRNHTMGGSMHNDNQMCHYNIYVDINGEKGPNQMCKDTFQFCIMQSDRMEPFASSCTQKLLSK